MTEGEGRVKTSVAWSSVAASRGITKVAGNCPEAKHRQGRSPSYRFQRDPALPTPPFQNPGFPNHAAAIRAAFSLPVGGTWLQQPEETGIE